MQQDKAFKAHVVCEKWKQIYDLLEGSVKETMALIKGMSDSGIGQLEMINIKLDAMETRLGLARGQLDVAQSLADSLVTDFPEQTLVTTTEQASKRTAIELMIETCRDLMSTMRSTGDTESSRPASASIPKAKGYLVPDFRFNNGPSQGKVLTTVSARGEVGVDAGVSRVSPSWDSSLLPPPASNQGMNGFRRQG